MVITITEENKQGKGRYRDLRKRVCRFQIVCSGKSSLKRRHPSREMREITEGRALFEAGIANGKVLRLQKHT